MRKLLLVAFVPVPVLVASVGFTAPDETQLETIALQVWNRSGEPVDLKVALGEVVVFEERVPSSDIPSAISAATVVHVPAGLYTVRVEDVSNSRISEVRVEVRDGSPNLAVHLIDNGLATLVTEHRWVADFMPGR